eukprot:CAMPEP_0118708196 /NCGR_PEP_ID=MMETSP0800-20121206/21721_1 /TAXON_ID=210618 ORGANISM="Striatella unipunctata, Strain CCMP2910" /NCGR_SAMPLE_ID=MMETSP0800 /ASSEMBLY_ACC=CAM_ASM_000638 /LENGTH=310 /DNA_ID=CAMNT_0006611299 /DNA_START=79 /DNA_END=1011 /DNA_ORIENTATION=+
MTKQVLSILSLLLAINKFTTGFSPIPNTKRTFTTTTALHQSESDESLGGWNRRDVLKQGIAAVPLLYGFNDWTAAAAETDKILVLGGTGLVGSEVCKQLKAMNIDFIATSTDGRSNTVALNALDGSVYKKVGELAKDCTAVISTIGVIGTENDDRVNAASGLAAVAAKEAGVKSFAYISVAPEVKEFAKGIDPLKKYLSGKTTSEEYITRQFPDGYTLVEPTFIFGGKEFGVTPPRVTTEYGQLIETILSSSPLRLAANIAPEGFIKIALEPPVAASDVAKAAIAGVLGKSIPSKSLDTYDKIKGASSLV